MQLHKFFTKKIYEQMPNVPVILGGDLNIQPNSIMVSKLLESLFVDLWTLGDQEKRSKENMNSLRTTRLDERYKFLPTNVNNEETVYNPYMAIEQA